MFKVTMFDNTKETVIKDYESGVTILELVDKYNIDYSTVRTRLKKWGVKLRKRGNKGGKYNYNWRGDDIAYTQLHVWVVQNFPKPTLCSECKIAVPEQVANISLEYRRDLSDWEWLCKPCHLEKYRGKKCTRIEMRKCKNCSGRFKVIYSYVRKKFCSPKCREEYRNAVPNLYERFI